MLQMAQTGERGKRLPMAAQLRLTPEILLFISRARSGLQSGAISIAPRSPG
jgi:hypothetical protein